MITFFAFFCIIDHSFSIAPDSQLLRFDEIHDIYSGLPAEAIARRLLSPDDLQKNALENFSFSESDATPFHALLRLPSADIAKDRTTVKTIILTAIYFRQQFCDLKKAGSGDKPRESMALAAMQLGRRCPQKRDSICVKSTMLRYFAAKEAISAARQPEDDMTSGDSKSRRLLVKLWRNLISDSRLYMLVCQHIDN